MTVRKYEVEIRRKVVRTKKFDPKNAEIEKKVVLVRASDPDEAWEMVEQDQKYAGWEVWSAGEPL